jgi:hypothetical protein
MNITRQREGLTKGKRGLFPLFKAVLCLREEMFTDNRLVLASFLCSFIGDYARVEVILENSGDRLWGKLPLKP